MVFGSVEQEKIQFNEDSVWTEGRETTTIRVRSCIFR